jgi:hypothetical protein
MQEIVRVSPFRVGDNSIRFAHALETFETELPFSVAPRLQGHPGWEFGFDSGLGLAALYI